jgi:hypothetical protein
MKDIGRTVLLCTITDRAFRGQERPNGALLSREIRERWDVRGLRVAVVRAWALEPR